MLILLPPSEGKAPGGYGPPVRLEALSLPALTKSRDQVLKALIKLAKGPAEKARDVLGLSPGQAEAVVRNRTLTSAPTLPAAELYTGVLYDNLGLSSLPEEARRRAADRILIFSGLWGVLRLDDAVPPYRLAMGVKLPPLGPLAAFWRPSLSAALQPLADGRLVVDMRSAPYAAAWRPRTNVVAVRVLQEQIIDGVARRSVVSHMAKATRGAVARALLSAGTDPADPEQLAKVLLDLGHATEITPTGVDVVISAQEPATPLSRRSR